MREFPFKKIKNAGMMDDATEKKNTERSGFSRLGYSNLNFF